MSVTTDLAVLQGWPKSKKGVSAAQVAAALKLTVFQITARLKGMEQRGFLTRVNGDWHRTDVGMAEAKNPSPSLVAATQPKVARPQVQGLVATPDDSRVKHIKSTSRDAGWRNDWKRNCYIAPDGREYVKAKFYETADLIVDWPKDGWDYEMFGVVRLRLLATSVVAKRQRRAEKVEEENVARTHAKKKARRHK